MGKKRHGDVPYLILSYSFELIQDLIDIGILIDWDIDWGYSYWELIANLLRVIRDIDWNRFRILIEILIDWELIENIFCKLI